MNKELKAYKNSLRLFLIFIGGIMLLNTIEVFAIFGGIGMVYSIMAFFINAEIPTKEFWNDAKGRNDDSQKSQKAKGLSSSSS